MTEFFVLWTAKCVKTQKIFYLIDDGDDPQVQCPHCSAEMELHHLKETAEIESPCGVCKGTGKRKSIVDHQKIVTCPTCQGTGIEKFEHTKQVVGRLYLKDLAELAEKNNKGWK